MKTFALAAMNFAGMILLTLLAAMIWSQLTGDCAAAARIFEAKHLAVTGCAGLLIALATFLTIRRNGRMAA